MPQRLMMSVDEYQEYQEYLGIRAEFVWLIDPVERQALWYSRSLPAGVLTETLHTVSPAIEIALPSVLPA